MTCKGYDAVAADICIKMETYALHHHTTFEQVVGDAHNIPAFSERLHHTVQKYQVSMDDLMKRIQILHQDWNDS